MEWVQISREGWRGRAGCLAVCQEGLCVHGGVGAEQPSPGEPPHAEELLNPGIFMVGKDLPGQVQPVTPTLSTTPEH